MCMTARYGVCAYSVVILLIVNCRLSVVGCRLSVLSVIGCRFCRLSVVSMGGSTRYEIVEKVYDEDALGNAEAAATEVLFLPLFDTVLIVHHDKLLLPALCKQLTVDGLLLRLGEVEDEHDFSTGGMHLH